MTDALPLHRRKPLTGLQRAKLFDDHKGICCICGYKIHVSEKWWDEHQRALALGGTNDMDNRGPAHVSCAKVKTKADVARISKAKRMRAKFLGAWPKSPRPLRGRGFQKRYVEAEESS